MQPPYLLGRSAREVQGRSRSADGAQGSPPGTTAVGGRHGGPVAPAGLRAAGHDIGGRRRCSGQRKRLPSTLPRPRGDQVLPFVLLKGEVWASHDLSDTRGPFKQAVDPGTAERLGAARLLKSDDKKPSNPTSNRTPRSWIIPRTWPGTCSPGLTSRPGRFPWAPVGIPEGTCQLGVTFYSPHGEKSAMRTSVAQAFAENGDAFVLRGNPFEWEGK